MVKRIPERDPTEFEGFNWDRLKTILTLGFPAIMFLGAIRTFSSLWEQGSEALEVSSNPDNLVATYTGNFAKEDADDTITIYATEENSYVRVDYDGANNPKLLDLTFGTGYAGGEFSSEVGNFDDDAYLELKIIPKDPSKPTFLYDYTQESGLSRKILEN